MATKTSTRAARKSTRPARKTTSQTSAKATKPASNSKKRADEATVNERRNAVQTRVIDGGESAATVAKDLGITSGKAAFIAMQLRVENGEVSKITGKTDDALIANVVKARDKADQFSSWGWLSARSGVAESALKNKVAAAGHEVAGTKIASVRKASRPVATKKAARMSATAAKTTAASKSKSTRTRTRRAQADPS
jgi:hypothetical protein